ncbi:tetratricopeptide repeat protein [Hyphococcus sp.]|uniref:tetratricopeptide repeat protein n=1 Tax=Hyphococcus sp. TaxID=2038636 RepID=UPI003753C555
MKRRLSFFALLRLALAGSALVAAPTGAMARADDWGPDAQGLEDVQVGEKDLQTRIALICDGPCGLEKRGSATFFLRGVTSQLSLDLSERSHNIDGFAMTPDAEGSLLNISTRRILEYANAKPCSISGRSATCVDLFFADAVAKAAQLATPSLAPKAETKPALRESAPERLSRFAALAPPERLTPPQGARLASVQPVRDPAETPPQNAKPLIRQERPLPAPAPKKLNYAAEIEMLLGKKLTPGFCASNRATLQSDPWALDAMVNVGLCEAASGKVEEADATLSRLLEYTPDNYEAYVGRAVIALQAGEKSIARRYFQNALDAPPPIAESSAIVAAMRAL